MKENCEDCRELQKIQFHWSLSDSLIGAGSVWYWGSFCWLHSSKWLYLSISLSLSPSLSLSLSG
jgi:hypothetical protein